MIYVVLPAYNEADNIGLLLNELRLATAESLPFRDFHVVVVDDGSQDATAASVGSFSASLDPALAPRMAVTLTRHEVNRGLAEALKTGLTHCAQRADDRSIILTMDSDNSHTPGLIPSMVRLIHEGYDVVIASRYQKGARVIGVSLFRRVLSRAASLLFRLVFPIPNVRDYTCGYRAYRAGLIKHVLASDPHFISEQGFSCMVDILLKLRQVRPEVMMNEVPLLLRYDRKQGLSKMNVRRTIVDTLKLLLRRRFGG